MLLNLLFFIIACIILITASTFLVKSLTKIAQFLRVSEYVIAFILMAFATSIPELFIGISSAMEKIPEISLGNVIGSNIADIALIGGIIILLAHGIKIKKKEIKKDSLWMLPIAALPLILFLIGNSLSRTDGIILIAVFFLYCWHLIKRKRNYKKFGNNVSKSEIVIYSMTFIVCLFLLFLSAEFVVKYAKAIAFDLMLPPLLISLFFVAVGTSLPELAFESRAVLMGKSELALGDLIGSIVVNSTLVLGVTSIIFPITTQFMLFLVGAIFMIFFIFLFSIFINSSKLNIIKSIILLLFYILFIIIELFVRAQ